ncbi:hypothetical protein DZS_01430 [Dickeya ananatis]
MLPNQNDEEQVARLAEKIIHDISQAVPVDDKQINTSASIGLVMYPAHGTTVQDLLTSADLALYQAKADGRNCYRFFTRELREVFQARHAFQLEFIRAYEQEEFEVFYQPQVNLVNNKIVGAEALLRWRHPYKGLLGPAAFMSALERGPWAERIGDWVVRSACQQASDWCRAGAKKFPDQHQFVCSTVPLRHAGAENQRCAGANRPETQCARAGNYREHHIAT